MTQDALDRLYRPILADLARVEAEIAQALVADRHEIEEMTAHVGRYSGKKMRPAIALMIAQRCGGVTPRHHRLGAVLEMIHLATLVHDDVIDGADMRRKSATANAKWSNFDAVLLGDILFARAINLLGRLGDAAALDELTRAVSTLCEGEILQNRHRRNVDLEESLYYRIIEEKTAILYAAGCGLSAHLGGAPTPVVDALRTYGLELGTAFQIVDDVLDLVGDEAVVGKSLGTDLRNGKMTLPVIFMRDATTPAGLALLTKVMKGEGDEADAAALRRALVEDGHVEAANVRARDHLRRGLEAVARAIPSAHADLEEIAGFVVVRAR